MNGKRETLKKVLLAILVLRRFYISVLAGLAALSAVTADGAEDPAGRALHEQQLMRQQQQDTLRLRMQQHNRNLQSPPSGAKERQARERSQIEQRQRQEQLHYRQDIQPPSAHSGDDADVQRAKAQMDRQRAQEESDRQLRRFDFEQQQGTERPGAATSRGEVRPPQPRAPLE